MQETNGAFAKVLLRLVVGPRGSDVREAVEAVLLGRTACREDPADSTRLIAVLRPSPPPRMSPQPPATQAPPPEDTAAAIQSRLAAARPVREAMQSLALNSAVSAHPSSLACLIKFRTGTCPDADCPYYHGLWPSRVRDE